ncbi:MAG: LacI family DNA-binding transcriptional regulator [Rhodospirillales bacterium]|nr:LacI family DNA-binding transcriptional regulator [Rhodospirillales bacterium]MDP6589042.1 LacI family DNA-binding transcriptional regulator [Alphaproteobacteria bacterium]MDP6843043.1 LacI family DNA-binding transcriptional regulator [Rhodospirillales bacterium]
MSKPGKSRKPTLKQVARHAGVSPSTVSLVIRDKGSLPDRTRQKVFRAIEETGYKRPKSKHGAAGMSAIGVIADDIENPYYAELFRVIDRELEGSAVTALLLASNGSLARQCSLIKKLAGWGCAGAVLIPANASGQETLDLIKHLDMPVVLGVRHLGFGIFDYVGPDYVKGMQLATQHLIDLGHKRIAFVGGKPENSAYSARLRGFRMTVSNAGAARPEVFEMEGPPTSEFGVEAMASITAMREPPTALIAYNDQLAFGLMSGARDIGLTVGKDIAIVGFDDVRAAAMRNLPLTTVSTPPSRIGAELARLLMARIKDSSAVPVNIIPPPRLKIRMSCCAPPVPAEAGMESLASTTSITPEN